jgi:hypothetical protein
MCGCAVAVILNAPPPEFGRSAADAEVASPCSHLANPELQKLIHGNRASAGRNKIKQHQCVDQFRLVKPIVDTICRVNRFVARNHRWRARQEGYRTNDQKAKGGQRCQKSDRDAQAAKEFNSRNKPLQYANVRDLCSECEDRFVKSSRSFDVGDGEKVCDGKPILRRHLIALLLDLSLAHGRLQFGHGISPLARIRRGLCFGNELREAVWRRRWQGQCRSATTNFTRGCRHGKRH